MSLGQRKLGNQGLEVSAIGLGCTGLSQSCGPANEAESIVTLHRAIEPGCIFFNTVEVYGPFRNEELIGRAFKGRRGEVVIATKFGFRFKGREGSRGYDGRSRRARQGTFFRTFRSRHIEHPPHPFERFYETLRAFSFACRSRP